MANPVPLTAADPARLGGWELLGRIGAGGQGVVYLGRPAEPAEPGAPHHRVAVKLLHGELLGDAGARERFVRELALVRRVAGFCTAQLLAAGMAGDRPYIVSEYIPGPSLRALVRRTGPRGGADLDRLAISSVTALAAIHRANVVHRDFKPQNVLVGPDGPRVIDFGIARAFDAGATLTSQIVGTPAYMAPEQFAGRAGPAADLFAWAGTLLFAATGRDPFAGGPLPEVMYRIMHDTPDLDALPGPIAEVAADCLAKTPESRPTSEDALLRLLGNRTGSPRPRPPAARPPAPTGREPAPSPADRAPPPPAPPAVHHPAPRTGEPPAGVPVSDPTVVRVSGPPGAGRAAPETRRDGRAGVRRRGVRRGPALVVGLVLAGFLAALDVAALAILIARPGLSAGGRGGALPVVAASFAVVAVVTLVAVILAWRGGRTAAWTVLAARVVRVLMWAAWGALVEIEPAALAGHAAVTAVVVALLARALSRSPG